MFDKIVGIVSVGLFLWFFLRPSAIKDLMKPKEIKEKKDKNIDKTYREEKEKEMYKRLARQEEREARMENEIRDRLNKK